jgi:hypothetical protein
MAGFRFSDTAVNGNRRRGGKTMKIVNGTIFVLTVIICILTNSSVTFQVASAITDTRLHGGKRDFIFKTMELIKAEQPGLSDAESYEIAKTNKALGDEFECIDPVLLMALQKVESAFNSKARGTKGELGINQIHPITAKELCTKLGWKYNSKVLRDINKSTFLACVYLDYLYQKYGSVEAMLVGYNCGPTYAFRFTKNSFKAVPVQGVEYVNQVLDTYFRYQDEINNT